MRARYFGLQVLLTMALAMTFAVATAWAAPTSEQRVKLKKANDELGKAQMLVKNQKYKEAGEAVTAAAANLTELAGEKDLAKIVEPLLAKARDLHGNLELQGVKLDPFPAAGTPAKGADAGKPVGVAGKGTVSFSKDVSPMLMQKCGKCHVSDSKGGFNMNTFAALEKGSKDGIVVMPGKGEGSRIVEVIKSGDMPRGGGKVTPAEVATLVKWIDEGAKFDGPDKTKPIAGGAAVKPTPDMKGPTLTVVAPSGAETVSFSRDLAPVLAANCISCHGETQPRARLDLDNFAALLRGSENGNIIVPGKSADSVLIKKIKGTSGERMPEKKPPLPDDVIAKFAKWVDEGAKFDGDSASQTMRMNTSIYSAKVSTHDQLQKARDDRAQKTWDKGNPNVTAARAETKNFLVLGNVGQAKVKAIADAAEQLVPQLSKIVHASPDAPLIKGRMTIFVFNKRYDYSEFGEMVEEKKYSGGSRTHWFYNSIDAYGAMLLDSDLPSSGMLAEQITSVYAASIGNHVPRWFADGFGRVTAAGIDAKDGRAKQWDDRLRDAMSSMTNADSLLKGGMEQEDAAVCAYSFVKYLKSNSTAFNSLMLALSKGQDFDQAFSKAFRGTPEQGVTAWAKRR